MVNHQYSIPNKKNITRILYRKWREIKTHPLVNLSPRIPRGPRGPKPRGPKPRGPTLEDLSPRSPRGPREPKPRGPTLEVLP